LPRYLGRLSHRRDFQQAYRLGRRYSDDSFVVYVLDREGAGLRIGVVVGRRHGGAVQRNRLRRRIREALRQLAPELRDGVDLVIIPRHGAGGEKRPFTEFVERLAALLSEAGVISEGQPSET
jgi:ribonuclease P protein component